MFAVDRSGTGAPWIMACVNRAWEQTSALTRADISGRPVAEVVPGEGGTWLCERYDECAEARAPTRYTEERSQRGADTQWETSLQYAPMAGGADRVIGTTLVVQKPIAPAASIALAEVRDFALEADYHLTRLTAFVDGSLEEALVDAAQVANVEAMSGLCRSVSSLLGDIRRIAEKQDRLRHGPGPWSGAPLMGDHAAEAPAAGQAMQTIEGQMFSA